MKVIVIKPKSNFESLRTEIVLKDHMVDYEIYEANKRDRYFDEPEAEDDGSNEIEQGTLQPLISETSTPAEAKQHPLEHEASVSAESEVRPMAELADVEIEPENLGQDFLKAQLSTKNQMKIRNVLAIISSIGVVIAFILEKLGVI